MVAIPSARALISSSPPFGARYQGGTSPQRMGTSARSPSAPTQTGTVSVGDTFGRASSSPSSARVASNSRAIASKLEVIM